MFAVAYRNTEAGAKRFVHDTGLAIAPPKVRGRANIISLSLEWQRRQEERAQREAERRKRQRIAIAEKNARWAEALEKVSGKPPRTHPDEIIAMVCAWHGVEVSEVMGKSRSVPTVKARYDAFAAVWFNCRLEGVKPNFPNMGRLFRRDHTVILHALRKLGILDKGRGEQ